MSMEDRGMTEKHVEAFRKYLELRGYEILDEDWEGENNSVDFVALFGDNEGDTIISFIDCGLMSKECFDTPHKTQEEFEALLVEYLDKIDPTDATLRYETLGICVVAPHKAIIRHAPRRFFAESPQVEVFPEIRRK